MYIFNRIIIALSTLIVLCNVSTTNGFYTSPTFKTSSSSMSSRMEEYCPFQIEGMQRFVASVVAATLLPLSTSPCLAMETELQCPESFSSQSLGIQNIVRSQTQPPSTLKLTTKSRSSSSSISYCPENKNSKIDGVGGGNVDEFSLHGLIYMPSSSITASDNNKNPPPIASDVNNSKEQQSLIITVSTIANPSVAIAGSQIPMSQIQSFPISFSLFKSNLLIDPLSASSSPQQQQELSSQGGGRSMSQEQLWDTLVLYYPKDLYVTAKICPGRNSNICTNEDATYQGTGYSKLLSLPSPTSRIGSSSNNDDDIDDVEFKLVRAAASVRLSQMSIPDALTTW